MWHRVRSVWRAMRRRTDFESGLADELRFHVDAYVDDLVRAGVTPDEARRRARLEFGNVDNVRLDCREARGLRVFDELQQHVRYALRRMRKVPAFTATALGTLTLCLGANLTIFALVDAVLLRPLPFPADDQLVSIFNTYPRAGVLDDGSTMTNYYERRGRIAALGSLAMYRDGAAIIGETGSTEREFITRVSPEFFATLGSVPAIGRAFTDAETTFETDDVSIVTDEYWKERLGADPTVIGHTIRVDGTPTTVVGILPAGFSFLSSKTRIYLPLASPPDERGADRRHSGSSSHMIARLTPGATIAAAQSQIDAHNAAMEEGDPHAQFIADAGFRSVVVSLRAAHVAAVRPSLVLVEAGVLCLLLIGAVNVLNLFLISYTDRVRELAVRRAMGASARHVVGEVLAQTTLLSLAGAILGLGVGAAGIRLLARLGASRLPLGAHVQLDTRVAAAALLGAVLVGIAIAIPVAWYSVASHASDAMQLHSRGSTAGRAAGRMRHGFLVAQISLAVVLLAGAGLLGVSLRQVEAEPTGFRPEHVLSGQVSLPWQVYAGSAPRQAFIDRLTEALDRQPGVVASGVATNIPLSGNSNKSSAAVKGYRRPPGESPRGIYSYGVAGNYFAAIGLPLLEGRFLTSRDARLGSRVCVVDEDFARRYWPRGGALGQHLFAGSEEGSDADAYTVVGIVGAVKQAGLAENEALGAVYYPYSDRFDSALYVVTRTTGAPESLALTLQRVVRTINPELPVNNIRSMETRIADSLVSRRSPAMLAALFSAVALLLTGIGTYGVLSYAVSQRRREIGLRIALGARPAQVHRQFVSLGARLLAAGLFVGLPGAWLTGRAMQAVLFNVPPLHLLTFGGAAAVMTLVTLAACLVPSQRAARVSPAEVLAEE